MDCFFFAYGRDLFFCKLDVSFLLYSTYSETSNISVEAFHRVEISILLSLLLLSSLSFFASFSFLPFAISAGSNPNSRALTGSHFLFDRQNFPKDRGGS